MSNAFRPLLLLFAGVAVGSVCLWFLIGQFLGSTQNAAAELASRAALRAGPSSQARTPSADHQQRGELLAQLRQSDSGDTVSGSDIASVAERRARTPAAAPRAVPERADSDDDIDTRRSIETLQLALADPSAASAEEGLSEPALPNTPGLAPAALTSEPVTSKPQPVLALDVSVNLADHCEDRGADAARIGVFFRPGSAAIKGRSLMQLDTLVAAARRCPSSLVIVEPLPSPAADGDLDLEQRRSDEIKYYLLQRGIDKEFMRFGDRS